MGSVGSVVTQNQPGVLLIVENLSVPADRRVWEEAKALCRAGYRVSVISPRGKHVDKSSIELKDDIAIYRFATPFDGNHKLNFVLEYAWALLSCFWLSMRIWRERGFVSVHAANPPDLFFPLGWFYKLFGKPYIFDMHDLSPETYLSKFSSAKGIMHQVLLWCEKMSLHVADAIIVTNESYREVILRRGKLSDDKIFTVRNSPNLELFYPREVQDHLKEGHRYMVSYIGVMGQQDGVDYLLRTAHHLHYGLGRKDVFFIVMGTGDAWDDLQKLHKELQLDRFVRFTGRIPDAPMWEYLSSADVGAAPDPHNPLNNISTMNKILEYMAMGKPVVSFDLREARHSAQKAAVYVDNNNTELFAQAIIELLDDPKRREEMGQYGRQRISTVLSWNHSEHNLRAAYRYALGSRAAAELESST